MSDKMMREALARARLDFENMPYERSVGSLFEHRDAALARIDAALDAALAQSRPENDGAETAALATMVYEAVRFCNWAAGEGFCPVAGEPAMDPADLLSNYVTAIGGDSYDGLPEVARDAVLTTAPPAAPASVIDFLKQWTSRESRPVIDVARDMAKAWDKGEHEGCGADSERAFKTFQAQAAPPAAAGREPFTAEDAWHDLIEKDDRNSPEDYPDMALITSEELADYINRATEASAISPQDRKATT